MDNWRQVKDLIAFLSAEQFVKNLEAYVKLFDLNLLVKETSRLKSGARDRARDQTIDRRRA